MIQPIGHFRIWRALYTKPIWLKSTVEQQVILITLMAMANFQPREWEWNGEKFNVDSGQFVTSLESIRVNTGGTVSIQNIRTALRRFEKLGFLTNESTKTGRLITLVNWEQYQYTGEQSNKDTNKDLTKNQQRPNKDLTPREEGKKVRRKEDTISDEFEKEILRLYPGKKVKATRDKKLPKILKEYSEEEVIRCISRYSNEVQGKDKQYILNESTFWNGRYIDYLDKNYKEGGGNGSDSNRNGQAKKTTFTEEDADRAGVLSL